MDSIKNILIARDGTTPQEADNLIAEAKDALYRYIDDGDTSSAEDICSEYFGLEPDYLDELMF